MARTIDIALLPAEADVATADCFVVVDVLRATTTIAALFAHGASRVYAAAGIDAARTIAEREGALLGGEIGGLPPPGFDFGNSPAEAGRFDLRGRPAVLFTTNGTLALTRLASRGPVLAGSLANGSAVARAIAPYDGVLIVCAGTEAGTRFALEDFAAAASLVQAIMAGDPGRDPGDGANLALALAAPERLIGKARHAHALREIGLAADIEYALRPDTSGAEPWVVAWELGLAVLEDRRQT